METQAPRRSSIVIALIFALSCFCVTLYVWISFGGSVPLAAKGYELHALFPQAAQLSPNADVRISGVNVGKVKAVITRGERSDATIQLDRSYAPIARDAHAILRSKTLLGETFVELTPGTPGTPTLADGGTLADANIEPTQGVDQVLGSFDAPTRQTFKQLLTETSASLAGRGADLNDALGNADPTVANLTAVVDALDQQGPTLGRLLHDTGTVLGGVGRRSADLQSLVTAGDQVLATTASRDRALTATVNALPPFVASLRATLPVVDQTAAVAAPTLRTLRPVTPLLRPALAATPAFALQLRLLFRQLGPVISAANVGLPAAARLLRATRPLFDVLAPTARNVVPLIEMLTLYRRELVTTMANVSAAAQGSTVAADGSPSHYLRFLSPINNEQAIGASQRYGSNRANPYLAPGALAALEHGTLPAFDCRSQSNPTPSPPLGPVAPCLVQAPFTFQGSTRAFPNVEPSR